MNEEINFYRLVNGECYRVVKSFTDYYDNHFKAGEKLIFAEQHFLPYDGGHTLVFKERKMYLQENEQSEIIGNLSDYLALCQPDEAKPAG